MLAQSEQLGEQAAKLAAAELWPLADDELTDLLRSAHRLEQAAAVLQTRIVRQAGSRGLPARQGHRDAAGWMRSVLRVDPRPAREMAALAAALDQSPEVEQALLDGRVDVRQAAAIASTMQTISAELADCDEAGLTDTSRIVGRAEQAMIDMAGRLAPYQLRHVGERILTHVAPDLADRLDEAALARQEARAHARRGITLSLPANGMVRVSGTLGSEEAAIVHAALHPLCRPTPARPDPPDLGSPGPGSPGDQRTPAQRRADALVEICRLALRTGQLPHDGGEPPQLAITVAYDPLTRTLDGAVTDTGQRLSAEAARRLACDARVLPIVLGGDSQILDAGRTRRLATGPLRRALTVRDRGCAFPDCDRPPRWTDAHHLIPWSEGGATSLDNLVLLCRHHHRTIHDPATGWTVRLGPDQLPEFIPPPSTDPIQRPRRNLYHHRLPPGADHRTYSPPGSRQVFNGP